MPAESKNTPAMWTNSKKAQFCAGCMRVYSAEE